MKSNSYELCKYVTIPYILIWVCDYLTLFIAQKVCDCMPLSLCHGDRVCDFISSLSLSYACYTLTFPIFRSYFHSPYGPPYSTCSNSNPTIHACIPTKPYFMYSASHMRIPTSHDICVCFLDTMHKLIP